MIYAVVVLKSRDNFVAPIIVLKQSTREHIGIYTYACAIAHIYQRAPVAIEWLQRSDCGRSTHGTKSVHTRMCVALVGLAAAQKMLPVPVVPFRHCLPLF